ncbi:MAG: hypothetical protein V3U09_03430 [Thermoplasmata archaeon]
MEYIGQMIYGGELLEGILPKSIVEEGSLLTYLRMEDPTVPVPGTTWLREGYA